MNVIHDLKPLQQCQTPIVLACGFFDGLHIGHRRILERAMEGARRLGGEAWVMTFDAHPLKILKPEAAPLLITSTNHKLSLLRQSGIDGCILLPFTRELGVLYFKQAPVAGEYSVDHSAQFVVLDRQVRVIGIIRPPHDPAAIADDLRRLLGSQ